ncbi:MAG TPA: helix-turn-helix domain-containing protein [Dehalococcoidia bacterium]|nr:helix-turn-helix domain-containing protein [Dehalococcoidia bacterium]
MAKTRNYQHYCPAARTLEVIGEKWSLLVVRDLLRGPQRFTDLMRFMGGITPKWLTQRLRDLEEAGIVDRDSAPGRREVWYRLTAKGRDLGPVVAALAVWGLEHAMRRPLPGETVHPELMAQGITAYMNAKRVRPSAPVTWEFRFEGGAPQRLRFDGERWLVVADVSVDVTMDTTVEGWMGFVYAPPEERTRAAAGLRIAGDPGKVREFLTLIAAVAPGGQALAI